MIWMLLAILLVLLSIYSRLVTICKLMEANSYYVALLGDTVAVSGNCHTVRTEEVRP